MPQIKQHPDSNDPLEQALALLKRLNSLQDSAGRPLPSLVEVDGFQPWWFVQEQLLWRILYPYTKNRAQADAALKGKTLEFADLNPELQGLARRGLLPRTAIVEPRAGSGTFRSLLSALKVGAAILFLSTESILALFAARLLRRDTLLYTLEVLSPGKDHDFRISSIYTELRARRYRFQEYGYTSDLATSLRNLFRRRRLVVYHEVLAELSQRIRPGESPGAILDIPALGTAPEDQFLGRVAQWAMRQSQIRAGQVRLLKRLFSFQKIRRAVILDDSRHTHELVAACQSLGIPVLGYMHGLMNRYHVGLMAPGFRGARRHTFDLYGVWSEYFAQRVLNGDLYEKEDLLVIGHLRLPEVRIAKKRTYRTKERIRVLVISEPRANKQEINAYLDALGQDPQIHILLKLRPGEKWPGGETANYTILDQASLVESFQAADVVLGTYSTILYEAALAHLPAVVLSTSFSYGRDIVEDGLAAIAHTPEELKSVIMGSLKTPIKELKRRKERMWGRQAGDSAAALFDAAEARLWPGRQ